MIYRETLPSVNDYNFKEIVFNSQDKVIVLFKKCCWGTAQIMEAILEKLAIKYQNEIKIYKYNLDESSEISTKFQIQDRTTIMFFNKDNLFFRTGVISETEIEKILTDIVDD
ncbi:thioredoxin [Candidatus Bathyarchaeota archaeon]|nr:thioredoxin [Candidatus Bathyarchaeota archaeon]